jgi:hypothetical protein
MLRHQGGLPYFVLDQPLDGAAGRAVGVGTTPAIKNVQVSNHAQEQMK